MKKAMTRKKRQESTDQTPSGVEVGRYNPRFYEIDRRVTASAFAGRYNFLTNEEREKMVENFEIQKMSEAQKGMADLSPL